MNAPESPLAPLLRVLDASFRVGRFFGTEVRVYGVWLIVLLMVVLPLHQLAWMPLGTRLLYAGLGLVCLYLTVWIHEMGHVLAGRRYRIDTPLITLSPLGGLAHMQRPAPGPQAGIVISAAGPATHLLSLALVWPLARLVGGSPFSWAVSAAEQGGASAGAVTAHLEVLPFVLARLVELNLTLLAFNLLPFYPLDGGSILRSALALRMHPNRATLIAARIGMAGAVGLVLAAVLGGGGAYGGVLVALAITNWFACQRALHEARYGDGPYAPAREPGAAAPEAWKQSPGPDDDGPRAGPRSRPRADAERGPGQDELDRLLERVHEVGIAGLTDAERASLHRASEARRSRS